MSNLKYRTGQTTAARYEQIQANAKTIGQWAAARRGGHFVGKLAARRYTRAQLTVYTKDFAMKRLIASFAALVAVACLVSACGQKGPLYLPDDAKHDGHSQSQHE